jgi:hypothetical protein
VKRWGENPLVILLRKRYSGKVRDKKGMNKKPVFPWSESIGNAR